MKNFSDFQDIQTKAKRMRRIINCIPPNFDEMSFRTPLEDDMETLLEEIDDIIEICEEVLKDMEK